MDLTPETHLKRRASKFCSGYAFFQPESSHLLKISIDFHFRFFGLAGERAKIWAGKLRISPPAGLPAQTAAGFVRVAPENVGLPQFHPDLMLDLQFHKIFKFSIFDFRFPAIRL